MQKINQLFNDTYFCTRILINSTRLRDTYENARDLEIESVEDEDAKQEIINKYRKKLQSVYRIRNNAFSYLLRNGFQCTYEIDEQDQSKIFFMNIEGVVYDAKESAVKNILGKEFISVAENCLPKDEFNAIQEEVTIEQEKEEREKLERQERAAALSKPKEKPQPTLTPYAEKPIEKENAMDLLDIFVNGMEIDKNLSKPVQTVTAPVEEKTEPVNIIAEPKTVEEKPKKIIRCPRCFAAVNEGETICGFCEFDLTSKNLVTKEEMDDLEKEEQFSDADIDKIFAELEKKFKEERDKQQSLKLNTTSQPEESPAPVVYSEQEDEENVKLYNPSKSEPSKQRNELIMDIYTLQLKDPKEESEEEVEEDTHKRKKKSEYLAELNSQEEPEEEDETIREVKIYVYPLSVPESGSELSSEILVYITQDGASGSFCSSMGGINTVKVNTDIHNFIVRGQWINGKFTTKVFANGKTLQCNCELSRTKEEIRPEDIVAAKLGHPITFLSVEYVDGTETMKIHSVPLASQNDDDGYSKALYLMENVNKKERNLFITKSTNYIAFEFEDEVYKATSKWDGDTYKMKIANY